MNTENITENKIQLADDLHTVSGYIARFDDKYFDGSEHRASMYEAWLKDFDERGIAIPLFWLHSSMPQGGRPIGAMKEWSMNDKGIYCTFQLSDTPFVRDEVIPSIHSGAMTHFSTEESDGDERVILAVALVPIGNAINARVEEMNKAKAAEETKPERPAFKQWLY